MNTPLYYKCKIINMTYSFKCVRASKENGNCQAKYLRIHYQGKQHIRYIIRSH